MTRRLHRCSTLRLALLCTVLALSACERDRAAAPALDEATVSANNRGVGLMGRFDYEAAREVFAELDARHPRHPVFRFNHAVALMNRQQEGDEARALEMFTALAAETPGDLRARYCTALLEFRRGELDVAATHLSAVVTADPRDAHAAYFLAQSLQQRGQASEALQWYRGALATDPYLRSAYYALSQLYRQQGDTDAAGEHIQRYQQLAHNPRAQLVEFKYTRMGAKCEAFPITTTTARAATPPEGPLFADPVAVNATLQPAENSSNLTVADINADGRMDLYVTAAGQSASSAVLLGQDDGNFLLAQEHPLSGIASVNTALWGDFDNDGQTDVYLCRQGGNQLWQQTETNRWQEITATTQTAGGKVDTVDGAFFDADHDGDLDLFLVNRGAPNELLNNNLDGTFRPIAAERGLTGKQPDSKAVMLLDLDRDRDTDLIVLNESPPHEVYVNELMWNYRPATGFDDFTAMPLAAAVSGDSDGDGVPEIYALDAGGTILRWQAGDAAWHATTPGNVNVGAGPQLELRDFNGDGRDELWVASAQGWGVFSLHSDTLTPIFEADGAAASPPGAVTSIVMEVGRGAALAALTQDSGLQLWPPGPGRHPFIGLSLSGLDNSAESMRSNASGIGTGIALRAGNHWALTDTFRRHSAPGQSDQPLVLGLGGATRLDYLALTWSDGVFQTELGLETGQLHEITETQRQLSSCPVLFAWNGQRYAFVSDLLGVGGIGYFIEPGVYAPPRPWENFLLPEGLLQAREGRYQLKIGEPMEEAAYVDAVRLVAWDLPPGRNLVLDERMAILGPEPTGEPLFYSVEQLPVRALNADGEDITRHLARTDLQAPPVGTLDRRFIGRLQAPQTLTLEFDPSLDGNPDPVLVIDGWVEYPYSQTMFAAWQAGADYRAPTLEARGADGQWQVVLEQFGYPAGMPRRMALPLPELPPGTTALRLSTNQEIYWDRMAVVYAETVPEARRTTLPLQAAQLLESGFALRTTGKQRQPHYDYDRRSPLWDTRHMAGYYTEFGPVKELVVDEDDATAIIGPGEELHLEFATDLPALPVGWTRRFVLESNGWAKDMDLYTQDGNTLAPLPSSGKPAAVRDTLHPRYNTRYRAGL